MWNPFIPTSAILTLKALGGAIHKRAVCLPLSHCMTQFPVINDTMMGSGVRRLYACEHGLRCGAVGVCIRFVPGLPRSARVLIMRRLQTLGARAVAGAWSMAGCLGHYDLHVVSRSHTLLLARRGSGLMRE